MTELLTAIRQKQDNASLKIVSYIHKKGLESKSLSYKVEVTNQNNWPFSVFKDAEKFAVRDLSDDKVYTRVILVQNGPTRDNKYKYFIEFREVPVSELSTVKKEPLVALSGDELNGIF